MDVLERGSSHRLRLLRLPMQQIGQSSGSRYRHTVCKCRRRTTRYRPCTVRTVLGNLPPSNCVSSNYFSTSMFLRTHRLPSQRCTCVCRFNQVIIVVSVQSYPCLAPTPPNQQKKTSHPVPFENYIISIGYDPFDHLPLDKE